MNIRKDYVRDEWHISHTLRKTIQMYIQWRHVDKIVFLILYRNAVFTAQGSFSYRSWQSNTTITTNKNSWNKNSSISRENTHTSRTCGARSGSPNIPSRYEYTKYPQKVWDSRVELLVRIYRDVNDALRPHHLLAASEWLDSPCQRL